MAVPKAAIRSESVPSSWAIRPVGVIGTLGASALLAFIAANVPPFVQPGANLTSPSQAVFARNIWPETQTSLVILAAFLPWLVYAGIRQGRHLGRMLIIMVAGAGVVLGMWATAVSLNSYRVHPRLVLGHVTRMDGRNIGVETCTLTVNYAPAHCSTSEYHLVVSDAELREAQSWVTVGSGVYLWVSPRGDAGFIGRPPADLHDLR